MSVSHLQAAKLSLTILKQVMEEKLASSNVEVAIVTAADGYQLYTKDQIEAIVAVLEEKDRE